jgi:hypothetical protein
MTVAFCIGNGESRQRYDLSSLRAHGKLYGSNAVHRDTTVDHLVCCDKRMVREALDHGYTGIVYTREDWMLDFRDPKVKLLPVFKWDQHEKWEKTFHWGSGTHSAHLALRHRADVLVMIGHDFWSADGLHNNLYKGTNNYQSVDYSAVDPRFWVLQFAILFAQFPDTQFFFCQSNIDNWKKPQEWETYSNVRYQELSTLTDNLISVTG